MNRFLVCILCGMTTALMAQEPTVRFEVASVKPVPAGSTRSGYRPDPTRLSGYFTVVEAMGLAYQTLLNRIVDVPQWARDERWEINARSGVRKPGELPQMMRHLLEERFALKVHRESRPMPAYTLSIARADGTLGGNLHRVERDCSRPADNPSGCGITSDVGRYRAGAQPWATFITVLEGRLLGRPIVDRTGLSGQFDIAMEWNPESVPGPGGAGNAPAGADLDARPALITAFQEQLGLKLQPATTPVDVIVIDSVDRPTPD